MRGSQVFEFREYTRDLTSQNVDSLASLTKLHTVHFVGSYMINLFESYLTYDCPFLKNELSLTGLEI